MIQMSDYVTTFIVNCYTKFIH